MDGRRDGCVLGTRERGLLVGDGHSGLALTASGMDKQRKAQQALERERRS